MIIEGQIPHRVLTRYTLKNPLGYGIIIIVNERQRNISKVFFSCWKKKIRYRIRHLISLKKSLVYGIIIIVNEREEEKQEDRKTKTENKTSIRLTFKLDYGIIIIVNEK